MGEVFEAAALRKACGYIDVRRLVRLGFVQDRGSLWNKLTRTDKLCPPRRQQRQNRNPRAYTGVFPWSLAAHWKRMQNAAHRIRYTIARRLSKSGRTGEDTMCDPIWLWSITDLRKARHTLEDTFGINRRQRGPFVRWYCHTDDGVYFLLAEMQVKPVIEAGRVIKFAALSVAEADAMLERRVAGSILERYNRAATNHHGAKA